MDSKKRLASPSALLLVTLLGVVVTYQALGARAMLGRPVVAATVNVQRVLEGLEQRAQSEASLRRFGETIIAEDETWKERHEELQGRLEALPDKDGAEAGRLRDEIRLTRLEFQEWRRFKNEQLDIEKSLMWRDIFKSIRAAVSELAEIESYDLVVVDDSYLELTINPESKLSREAQLKQHMSSRRFLYASSTIDITDDLIERMNNVFAAGG